MMTAKMLQALKFMRKYHEENEIMPSYREMANGLGLSSLNSVHRLVLSLEERGKIRRLPSRARAIELVE